MINVNRREVLKALTAAGLFCAPLPFGLRSLAFATEESTPTLVVIHLRGGCDGLNLISPADDPDFIAARPAELRVLKDGKDAGYALGNNLSTPIDFRLHAMAGGLNELYQNKHLAFIHACGLIDSTRSHFVATDIIEAGIGSTNELLHSQSGWLTRAIRSHTKTNQGLEAFVLNGLIPGDLLGLEQVLAATDINNGLPSVGGDAVATALWQMYSHRNDILGKSVQQALKLPSVIDQRISRDPQGHIIAYTPENGANYDKSGGFGSVMKSAARLIKMEVGLQAITLDYGGWDNHENQAGAFRNLVSTLSTGLNAFWNDINAYHNRVALVMITEFGRRLRSNNSGGTDHGRASVMTVLGGNVQGGKLYGKWPGLSTSQLIEGVDLAVTTDYRQVLSEILLALNAGSTVDIFPGFRPINSLGLFTPS